MKRLYHFIVGCYELWKSNGITLFSDGRIMMSISAAYHLEQADVLWRCDGIKNSTIERYPFTYHPFEFKEGEME